MSLIGKFNIEEFDSSKLKDSLPKVKMASYSRPEGLTGSAAIKYLLQIIEEEKHQVSF
jgi:hypothetical protein